jgi:hypothetical protein
MKTFNHVLVYTIEKFECDLCKQGFPRKIKIKDEVHSLIDFQKPENFIILEASNKEKQEIKSIFVIDMKNLSKIRIVKYRFQIG